MAQTGAKEGKALRFILSSKAGRAKDLDYLETCIRTVLGSRDQIDICRTEHADHARELAAEWAQVHGDGGIVYAAGGDGTLSEVAQVLMGKRTAMGVIPKGTANDFARSLYAKRADRKMLERLLLKSPSPEIIPVDLLKVNGHISMNVISLGYDTVVLEQAYKNMRRWPELGKRAFLLAVLQTLFKPKRYPLTIRYEDASGQVTCFTADAAIAVMANARFYGGGFQPTPRAQINDGLGDLLIADRINFFRFIPLLLRYPAGRHITSPFIRYEQFVKCEILAADGKDWAANYDGEVFYSHKLEVEVLKGALRLARLDYPGTENFTKIPLWKQD